MSGNDFPFEVDYCWAGTSEWKRLAGFEQEIDALSYAQQQETADIGIYGYRAVKCDGGAGKTLWPSRTLPQGETS